MQIKGKVAFVTGGAKRIGRTIAHHLASSGCHVAIQYNTSGAEAEKALLEFQAMGVKGTAVHGDISKQKDVVRMAKEIEETLGPVDILVNNASIYERTPWPEISEKDWDAHLNVNTKGPFFCAQAFAPSMVKRKQGKIINLVDWATEKPYKDYLPYFVSKAALAGMTKVLAKELAPYVQVLGIALGPMLLPSGTTEEEKKAITNATLVKRIGTPEEVARTVAFMVEGTDFATGSIFYLDGGRSIA